MKIHHLLIIAAATLLTLPACERKQTTSEKIKDKVDDALDRRPGEKVRDAGEDLKDLAKDAKDGVKDAVKDTTK